MSDRLERAREILELWKNEYRISGETPSPDDENAQIAADCGFAEIKDEDDGDESEDSYNDDGDESAEPNARDKENRDKKADFYTKDLEEISEILDKKEFPIKDSVFAYILAYAVNDGNYPYRSIVRPDSDRFDEQYSLYRRIFNVASAPVGKWPSKFSPSFMQEAAITLFCNRGTEMWNRTVLKEKGDTAYSRIFSVNGPPGTGKTTLLKEIIAVNVVEKALIMSSIDTPDEMFCSSFSENERVIYTKPGRTYTDKDGNEKQIREPVSYGHLTIHVPKDELVRCGITVASNNNKAVENLSLELPVDDYVMDFASKNCPSYNFENYRLKDYYIGKVGEERWEKMKNSVWGMVALALGNGKNMDAVAVNVLKPLFGYRNFKRKDDLDYDDARKRFLEQYEKVGEIRKKIEKTVFAFNEYYLVVEKYEEKYGELDGDLIPVIDKKLREIERKREELSIKIEAFDETYRSLKEKSGITWFSLLFGAHRIKGTLDIIKAEKEKRNEASREKDSLRTEEAFLRTLRTEAETLWKNTKDIPDWYPVKDEGEKAVRKETGMVHLSRKFVRDLSSPDTDTARKAHECCPWTTGEFNREREKLFLYALEFSMKFCLSSEKFHDNMRIYSRLWVTKSNDAYTDTWDNLDQLCYDDKQAGFIGKECRVGAWNVPRIKVECIKTLQLLVPLVSTTFAAVSSLYPLVPYHPRNKEEVTGERYLRSIGTLVIDEAGQAVPYSAVGAILRADSVMVVGDPLQIPPVVTNAGKISNLPVSEEVGNGYLDVHASVQSFADTINPFGDYKRENGKPTYQWLGCPLVIHRRCIDPMFSISNMISYGGSMINATRVPSKSDDEKAGYVIHKSFWADIDGTEIKNGKYKHYVREQGDFVIGKIKEALEKKNKVFVISPFKTVIGKLIKECNNAGISGESLDGLVGTVHTFQGKEAPEVFFLLGCDWSTGKGTFSFVSENILNVAVSRAKLRLCVVGSRSLWSKRNGNFARMSELIGYDYSEEIPRQKYTDNELTQEKSDEEYEIGTTVSRDEADYLSENAEVMETLMERMSDYGLSEKDRAAEILMERRPESGAVEKNNSYVVHDYKNEDFIYHMTSIDNLDSILKNGLLSRNELRRRGLTAKTVSNERTIWRKRDPRCYSCVPFHFFEPTFFTYRITNGFKAENFCYIAVARSYAEEHGFMASTKSLDAVDAEILPYKEGFERIDWETMDKRNYHLQEKREVCDAECLSPSFVAVSDFCCIYVRTEEEESRVRDIVDSILGSDSKLEVEVSSELFK